MTYRRFTASVRSDSLFRMEIEETIEIARPVADVHAYLRDPSKLPDWIDGLVDFELHSDGSFEHVISQAGRKMLVNGRLEDGADGDTVIMTLEGDEGMLRAVNLLQTTATGTMLVHRSSAKLHNPLLRMLLSGMKEAARRRLRSDLERLRDRLEA